MDSNRIWEVYEDITTVVLQAYAEITARLKTDATESTMALYGVGPFDPSLQVFHGIVIFPLGIAVDNDSGQEVIREVLDLAVAKVIEVTGEKALYLTETLLDDQTPSYVLSLRIVFEGSDFYSALEQATNMLYGPAQDSAEMNLLRQFFKRE